MTRSDSDELPGPVEQEFTIHLLNTYDSIFFPVIGGLTNNSPSILQRMAREMHKVVVDQLAVGGIKYTDLRAALTPARDRKQVAFVFDSILAGDSYGEEIAKSWLPALRKYGPEKTAIMQGDLIGLPAPLVHSELEKHLVGSEDFTRTSPEMYFVVYFTNLSKNQMTAMATMLKETAASYLGYVDCSTWIPLKRAMTLPQFGLRLKNSMIMREIEGYSNGQFYPVEENGFKILGIDEHYYDALLTFRLDQGIPAWAAADGDMSLNVLGARNEPVLQMNVRINESRIENLLKNHYQSLESAGLVGLNSGEISASIKEKMGRGLIYNLRFQNGTRAGVPAPENDAYMFTMLTEFPDVEGKIRQFTISIKYSPETHVGEVVTII